MSDTNETETTPQTSPADPVVFHVTVGDRAPQEFDMAAFVTELVSAVRPQPEEQTDAEEPVPDEEPQAEADDTPAQGEAVAALIASLTKAGAPAADDTAAWEDLSDHEKFLRRHERARTLDLKASQGA